MKRWICVLLSACVSSLAMAGNPEKENRLKSGGTIYAFVPVTWSLTRDATQYIGADLLTCNTLGCEYTVAACKPLYVYSQVQDKTAVLPTDERIREAVFPTKLKNLLKRDLVGQPGTIGGSSWRPPYVFLSGGWSSEFERAWSPSENNCLGKIAKQPPPSPSPAASYSPTPTASPAPSPSASPTPTP